MTVETRSFRRLAARTATEVFAPAVVVVAVSLFVALAVTLVITHWWQASAHAAVASAAAILTLTYGPVLLVSYAAVAIVCWSWVELRDHTATQVLVGAVRGLLVGGSVFLLLRRAGVTPVIVIVFEAVFRGLTGRCARR